MNGVWEDYMSRITGQTDQFERVLSAVARDSRRTAGAMRPLGPLGVGSGDPELHRKAVERRRKRKRGGKK